MITVYLCFLAGGAVLPIASFLLGFLNSGVDTDISPDVDVSPDLDINTDIGTDFNADAGADINTGADIGPATDINPGIDTMISVSLLPTSLMSLSSMAIIFGAVGSIMTLTGRGKIITFVISLITGYLMSVVIQTIIKSLRKAQTRSNVLDENELLLYDGTVIDTILPGQLGSVSFVTLKDERVSYPARCTEKELRLGTGRVVKVKEIKNGVFIVEPKNKYE